MTSQTNLEILIRWASSVFIVVLVHKVCARSLICAALLEIVVAECLHAFFDSRVEISKHS
jgi:hypothetical protein